VDKNALCLWEELNSASPGPLTELGALGTGLGRDREGGKEGADCRGGSREYVGHLSPKTYSPHILDRG